MVIDWLKKNSLFRIASELPGVSQVYHYTLALAGALWHGFPSRKIIVIGVTGTKGKTTTCNLIAHLLNAAGHKTGMATTVNFRIGDKEWVNNTKQTMLGRFALQGLLRRMVREGCVYAVIETSSEGIRQYRQRFIKYQIAVFTNISPEHIDRHGSFEKYRAAKVKLFKQVSRERDGIGVYNLDDPNVEHFLAPEVSLQYGYAWKSRPENTPQSVLREIRIDKVELGRDGTKFEFGGRRYEMPLLGAFNVYNAAAALAVVLSQDVGESAAGEALRSTTGTPGRFEALESKRGFRVIIDYAHEPMSLAAIYSAVREIYDPKRVIGVLGSQGGGRDAWKREAMGKIAGELADEVILTNEDPYDEEPHSIMNDIEKGVRAAAPYAKCAQVIDRREAIYEAISRAGKGDAVVITGKGGEVWMCVADGKKIPWSDRAIVEESLRRSDSKKERGRDA